MLEYAVVGKQPVLSPRSTAKREPLPPTELGDGTVVSTGAIVFAGTTVGARRDRRRPGLRPRARARSRDDVVVGRGSLVENDTTIGARDEDPGRGLHHRLLDARGGRLHRALRRDDERQLHGPHRAAARADQGADDPPRRPHRRRRGPLPGRRDRRGGVRRRRRRRHEGRPGEAVVVGNPARGRSETCRPKSCSDAERDRRLGDRAQDEDRLVGAGLRRARARCASRSSARPGRPPRPSAAA